MSYTEKAGDFMSNVYNRKGEKIKTYNKAGEEISVISTLQANHEWALQYKETILAERIALIEAVIIAGIIAEKLIKGIAPWKR